MRCIYAAATDNECTHETNRDVRPSMRESPFLKSTLERSLAGALYLRRGWRKRVQYGVLESVMYGEVRCCQSASRSR